MDVEQTVTDVGQIDVTGNRRFLERSISSRVAVRSGESVCLGGLIRENAANKKTGCPGCTRRPLLGRYLARPRRPVIEPNCSLSLRREALYNDAEIRQVSDEMRDQIQKLRINRHNAQLMLVKIVTFRGIKRISSSNLLKAAFLVLLFGIMAGMFRP